MYMCLSKILITTRCNKVLFIFKLNSESSLSYLDVEYSTLIKSFIHFSVYQKPITEWNLFVEFSKEWYTQP